MNSGSTSPKSATALSNKAKSRNDQTPISISAESPTSVMDFNPISILVDEKKTRHRRDRDPRFGGLRCTIYTIPFRRQKSMFGPGVCSEARKSRSIDTCGGNCRLGGSFGFSRRAARILRGIPQATVAIVSPQKQNSHRNHLSRSLP